MTYLKVINDDGSTTTLYPNASGNIRVSKEHFGKPYFLEMDNTEGRTLTWQEQVALGLPAPRWLTIVKFLGWFLIGLGVGEILIHLFRMAVK
jgi:hypothetical protein